MNRRPMNKQRAAKTFNHATSRTKKINTAPTPQRADSGSSSALLSPTERAPGSTWCATHVPENRTVEYETALRQMHRMQTGSFQTMAIRLMHEAQQHNKNSFITLTLNEQTLASRCEEREPRFPVPSFQKRAQVAKTQQRQATAKKMNPRSKTHSLSATCSYS